jgi:hypothetical protein
MLRSIKSEQPSGGSEIFYFYIEALSHHSVKSSDLGFRPRFIETGDYFMTHCMITNLVPLGYYFRYERPIPKDIFADAEEQRFYPVFTQFF